jgi:catechol 2,3-dioxygenase-like lactoylglutathione lyase family enzyme
VPRAIGINHVAVEVRDLDEAIGFFAALVDDLELRGRGERMAFVDLADQFVALELVPEPRSSGHYGLVVDGREEALRRAREAGFRMVGDNDVLDPSGNHWQIVDYADVQFSKAPRVLEGMGLAHLGKSALALAELRAKGLED